MPDSDSTTARPKAFDWRGWGVDFVLPLGLAALVSWWMTSDGRELAWQRALTGPDGEWESGKAAVWQGLYRYGPMPAMGVGLLAIFGIVAGIASVKWRRWRRVFVFLVLSLALGPGVLANLVFKEYWGRPRPREVAEFGGRQAYEVIWPRDPAGEGKSFPCGHATVGFFFVAGYFILRRKRRGLALLALGGGLAFGGLLGYTRMAQGGHFASDVIWAGAIVFVAEAGVFRALGLHRRLLDDRDPPVARKSVPVPAMLGGGLAAMGMVAGVLLGTPYSARRDWHPLTPGADTLPLKVSLTFLLGEITVRPGASVTVSGEAVGHGVPTSEIAERWEEEVDGDGFLRLKYRQRSSGYLTEVSQQLAVTIPWSRTAHAKLGFGPGESILALNDSGPEMEDTRIALLLDGADLTLELDAGARLWIDPEGVPPGTVEGLGKDGWWRAEPATPGSEGPVFRVTISEWKNGARLSVTPRSGASEGT